MARVVVAGWIGSTNLGDELVLKALLRKLRDREATVVGVSTDPDGTRRDHGIVSVDHRRADQLAEVLGSADALVFGGGGLLQDQTSRFNLPYHLHRVGLARARRVPVAMVGVGAGPLRTAVGQMLVRKAFDGTVLGSVRDRDSAVVLESLGLARPELAADLALSLNSSDVAVTDRLAVCLRPWHGGGVLPAGQSWKRGLDEDDWFVGAMAKALDDVASRTGLGIHFVALQADRDAPLHRLVAERMGSTTTSATPDLEGIVDEIASCRATVTMRYHGAVAATLGHRPSVLLGYTEKVTSFAEDLGEGCRGLSLSPEGVGRVPTALDDVLDRDELVHDALRRLRVRELGNDDAIDRLLAARR